MFRCGVRRDIHSCLYNACQTQDSIAITIIITITITGRLSVSINSRAPILNLRACHCDESRLFKSRAELSINLCKAVSATITTAIDAASFAKNGLQAPPAGKISWGRGGLTLGGMC